MNIEAYKHTELLGVKGLIERIEKQTGVSYERMRLPHTEADIRARDSVCLSLRAIHYKTANQIATILNMHPNEARRVIAQKDTPMKTVDYGKFS